MNAKKADEKPEENVVKEVKKAKGGMTDSVTITLMMLHITVHNLQKVKQNTHLIPICLRYFRIIGFLRRQEKKPAKKRVCHILRTENSIDP